MTNDLIPHDVVRRALADGASPARAWREHLGLTQAEIANRLGVSESAYAPLEASAHMHEAPREKIAGALGITAAQLDF
jgi:transcriptional regulator with XRE-family HTH domain